MSNKEKFLASAQKFLAKGQIQRAIKDYQKVVEIDPKDIRNRQKLAELYSRARMTAEAIDSFEAVARHYAENGFNLKAIAVYKQIQRLDPAQSAIYLRLAQLNEKQGLIGNALAEYRTLVGFYEKHGMLPEAVDILQKMRDIEPENLNIRVKIIETLLQAKKTDQARNELGEMILLLESKHDHLRLQKVLEFFLPQFPEDPQVRTALAKALIRKKETARGIALLQEVLAEQPNDCALLSLLAEGFRAEGEFGRERQTCRDLLEMRPGDLPLRLKIVRTFMDERSFAAALEEMESLKETVHEKRDVQTLKSFYERLKEELPEDERVLGTLQSLYEITGEGDKFLDILSESTPAQEGVGEDGAEEEAIFTASVLEEAVGDLETEEDFLDHEGAEEIPLEFLEAVPLAEASAPGAHEGHPPELPDFDVEMELELDLEFDPDEAGDGDVLCADAGEDGKDVEPEDVLAALTFEAPSSGDGDFFDLRSAVLEEPTPPSQPRASASPMGAGPKKGIKTDVEVEDSESHYNLGIAYKEMGLLDDAVKEFEKAMDDPSLTVACLTLKGICLVEKENLPRAEEAFQEAIAFPKIGAGEKMGLHYELALLYEKWDRLQDALEHFSAVAAVDSLFRDCGEKVRTLRTLLGLDPAEEKEAPRRKDRVSYV